MTDLADRISRGLGIPGETAQLLADRTAPVLVVETLSDPPATDPAVIRDCWGKSTQASAAGEYSKTIFRNPAGSGFIALIDQIWPLATQTNSLGVELGIAPADTITITTAGIEAMRDSRYSRGGTLLSPAVIVGAAAGVQYWDGAPDAPAKHEIFNDHHNMWQVGLTVSPGWEVIIELDAVSNKFETTWFWREVRDTARGPTGVAVRPGGAPWAGGGAGGPPSGPVFPGGAPTPGPIV